MRRYDTRKRKLYAHSDTVEDDLLSIAVVKGALPVALVGLPVRPLLLHTSQTICQAGTRFYVALGKERSTFSRTTFGGSQMTDLSGMFDLCALKSFSFLAV